MKVIEHGNRAKKEDKQKKRFKCEKCGCVFECSKDEYVRVDPNQWSYSMSYTWSTIDKLYANCPECHKICEIEEKRYQSITVDANDIRAHNGKGSTTTATLPTTTATLQNKVNFKSTGTKTIAVDGDVIVHKHPSEE